jgi:hypothetical protein
MSKKDADSFVLYVVLGVMVLTLFIILMLPNEPIKPKDCEETDKDHDVAEEAEVEDDEEEKEDDADTDTDTDEEVIPATENPPSINGPEVIPFEEQEEIELDDNTINDDDKVVVAEDEIPVSASRSLKRKVEMPKYSHKQRPKYLPYTHLNVMY